MNVSPQQPQAPDRRSRIETPSGKHAGYENFPVGSWLLPARLRPHILTFYHFARAIDDIADSPELLPEDKLKRLETFARVLTGKTPQEGYEKSLAMAVSLDQTGTTNRHCLDLVAAFRQDATKNRYDDWDDLIAYCMLSAAPVGRYLIDLHGGCEGGYASSDALCCALQVLNHVQDCADDYRTLDRVYVPQGWLVAEKASPDSLEQPRTSPELRRVLNRMLDATDTLLDQSRSLSAGLNSRRLAMEAAFIQRIAEALSQKLRHQDPLAERIALGPFRYGLCGIRGVVDGVFFRS